MVRALGKTLSRCAAAAANYLFGRDMDGVAVPEANPAWVRAVRGRARSSRGSAPKAPARKSASVDPPATTVPAPEVSAPSFGVESPVEGRAPTGGRAPEAPAAAGAAAKPLSDTDRARLAEAVEMARREWVAARHYFDNVVEPDLIDYAVLSIGAAERRYMYLLEQARRAGVHVDPLSLNV